MQSIFRSRTPRVLAAPRMVRSGSDKHVNMLRLTPSLYFSTRGGLHET